VVGGCGVGAQRHRRGVGLDRRLPLRFPENRRAAVPAGLRPRDPVLGPV